VTATDAGTLPADVSERKEIARLLLDAGTAAIDLELEPVVAGDSMLLADLGLPFPDGLAPEPQPIDPVPARDAPLPKADVVVVTWTVAELNALADVLTPGHPRTNWYRYARGFEERYLPQIRENAPSRKAQRMASWFPTKIGSKSVLCMKSELHLNQDGVATGPGTATLPVKDLFRQIIDEAKPQLILTVGTSGGVKHEHDLGDVVVTRAAKFRLADEVAKEPFAGKTYRSDWAIPTQRFPDAEKLMAKHARELEEPDFGPPTKRYGFDGPLLKSQPPNAPSIHIDDGESMPKFHPILTTDFFEFGTSANNLWTEGCAVEMGDAVLGLVAEELGDAAPDWAIVRNLSDPMINGDLPTKPHKPDMQAHWAVWYYEAYGYWTSVMGALATWGIIAGLEDG
jgi:nucleoside phosphorylase